MSVKVEIAKRRSHVAKGEIEDVIWNFIQEKKLFNNPIFIPSKEHAEFDKFQDELHCISFDGLSQVREKTDLRFIYYEFSSQGPEIESIESCGDAEETISAATHWILPNKDDNFCGLWESLVFDQDIKEKLLKFAETMLYFSQKRVSPNIVSCNRLMLLHGPPGTGKTSLAKAIAQKLSIRMGYLYQCTHLFEINSHSLFSKWYSESGKLVMKMFQQIQEVIELESSLVCVLIDEVESIAYARGNISANEPSDSVRVVNAVLTQLDKIKKYPNVLIITTSNLTSSIDLAFLDRADIVTYIGHPSLAARQRIISSTITELTNRGVIVDKEPGDVPAELMAKIISRSDGLSGRALRKLPFLAHALFMSNRTASIMEFCSALLQAVIHQKENQEKIEQSDKADKDQMKLVD